MVLHSSSLFVCNQTDRFRKAHLPFPHGKTDAPPPHQSKVFEGMGGAGGKGNFLQKVSLPPALSPYLFAMPVNAAGKSAEAAADERAGRPASAGEGTKASTEDRTPGSAAQEALLGLVHVRAANGPENQRADQKYG